MVETVGNGSQAKGAQAIHGSFSNNVSKKEHLTPEHSWIEVKQIQITVTAIIHRLIDQHKTIIL